MAFAGVLSFLLCGFGELTFLLIMAIAHFLPLFTTMAPSFLGTVSAAHPQMAGHVPIDVAVEYPSLRGTAAALAGNGTGSPWWPLTPGTCIDYDVFPVKVSWSNATNALGITSRGAKQAPQRICAYTRDCPGCGYGAMPPVVIWHSSFLHEAQHLHSDFRPILG